MSEPGKVDAGPRIITQAEYARIRGVSRQAISQAVKLGRLTATPDGRIELSKADAELLDNTDFSQVRLFDGEPRTAARAQVEPPRTAAPAKTARPRTNGRTFNSARTEREDLQAQLSRLDLKERQGHLTDADAVWRTQFNAARSLRDALLTIPQRAAIPLASTSDPDECRRILEREIRTVCEELEAAQGEVDE